MKRPMGAISLRAEYAGRCKCGRRFGSGTSVQWNPDTRKVEECDGCRPLARNHKQPGAPFPRHEDLNTTPALDTFEEGIKRIQRDRFDLIDD